MKNYDIKQLEERIETQRMMVRCLRTDAENPKRLLVEADRVEHQANEMLRKAVQLRQRAECCKEKYLEECAKLEELVKFERLLKSDAVKELLSLQKKIDKKTRQIEIDQRSEDN